MTLHISGCVNAVQRNYVDSSLWNSYTGQLLCTHGVILRVQFEFAIPMQRSTTMPSASDSEYVGGAQSSLVHGQWSRDQSIGEDGGRHSSWTNSSGMWVWRQFCPWYAQEPSGYLIHYYCYVACSFLLFMPSSGFGRAMNWYEVGAGKSRSLPNSPHGCSSSNGKTWSWFEDTSKVLQLLYREYWYCWHCWYVSICVFGDKN